MEMKGIIVPLLTPMRSDESIDEEALRLEIERLLSCGVHGIFPSGTNGEAYALSEAEKERILSICIDQVNGRVPVYAGTGMICTRDTIRLSQKAESMRFPSSPRFSHQRRKRNFMNTIAKLPHA